MRRSRSSAERGAWTCFFSSGLRIMDAEVRLERKRMTRGAEIFILNLVCGGVVRFGLLICRLAGSRDLGKYWSCSKLLVSQ